MFRTISAQDLGGNALPSSETQIMPAAPPGTEQPHTLELGLPLEGEAARGGNVDHSLRERNFSGSPRVLDEGQFMHFASKEYFSWLHNVDITYKSKAKSHFNIFRRHPDNGCSFISPAPYMNMPNTRIRTLLARFRSGSHDLRVEQGRWNATPHDERLCECCRLNKVEDEMHFIFDCELYYEIRGQFFAQLFEGNDRNMEGLFIDNKLMDVGLYIEQCMEVRNTRLLEPRD